MLSSPGADAPRTRGPDERRVAREFAAWMTGSHAEGAAEVAAAEAAGAVEIVRALAAVIHAQNRRQRRDQRTSRRDLDDLLRSDPTVAVGLDHPLVGGDPRRLRVLQTEMRRVCLTATLRTLPVAPRAAFVLREILRVPFALAVEVFGTEGALRTAHCRAMRQLETYLEARCEHIHPDNACRCASRLGVALERGFFAVPTHDDVSDPPGRPGVASVYATLPPPPAEGPTK